jgi:type IV pilus assembly protein PilA
LGRKRSRRRVRGFTLVELMIVVAIVGVLAGLAVYGVRRYLAVAKTSEAKQNVGGIARAAIAYYERETPPSEDLADGTNSTGNNHDVCNTSTFVPTKVPQGKKYQPSTVDGKDFNSGTDDTGWKCLKFSVTQPILFRYHYGRGTATQVAPNNPKSTGGASKAFEAAAEGDLDGDGVTSKFAITGKANLTTQALIVAPQIYIEDETE